MDDEPTQMIDGYKLVQTCFACPEQYDVFDAYNTKVGYLRLRHGTFTVDCPFGETILMTHPKGDGIFESDERDMYLSLAIRAIDLTLEQRAKERNSEDDAKW